MTYEVDVSHDCNCDKCNSKIRERVDTVFCESCYEELKDKAAELQEKIYELEAKIEELEAKQYE